MYTNEGFDFDGTHEEVIEGDLAIPGTIAMLQSIQNAIVQMVAGRLEGLAQLEAFDAADLGIVIAFEDRLPFGNVGEQSFELFESKFTRLIGIQHGDHRTTHVLREAHIVLKRHYLHEIQKII